MRHLLLIPIAVLTLSSCQKAPEESAGHGHDESEEGAVFKEGHGLSFGEETKQAIGLELAEAASREIARTEKLNAQIYRSADEPAREGSPENPGMAYATILVEPDLGSQLKPGDPVKFSGGEGRVSRVETTQQAALGKSEVLVELPDPQAALQVGTFLPVEFVLARKEAVAIPATAVLETADGPYAYVQNGASLLRTPITTGSSDGEWVEITDGLYEGDVVAAKPVSTLYLTELRATKGGGHCH